MTEEGAIRTCQYGEYDCRSTFAGIVVAKLSNCLDKINWNNTIQYLSQFLQNYHLNCHLAYVYCSLAGLSLLGQHIQSEDLFFYILNRQQKSGGINGRPNKLSDGCYSYWFVGSLFLLNKQQYINQELLQKFITNCCQDEQGYGCRDKYGTYPDRYHTHNVLQAWDCINNQDKYKIQQDNEIIYRWQLGI